MHAPLPVTLLFRSLGAVIFGLISDRFGRKWPLVVNLIIVAVLELATAFTTNFNAFLAVRSLFGVGMGQSLFSPNTQDLFLR